jgi:hypothetical protein
MSDRGTVESKILGHSNSAPLISNQCSSEQYNNLRLDGSNQSANLLADFRKILELFDKETQIYKEQISVLKHSIAELQENDTVRINQMAVELKALRGIITNLDEQTQQHTAHNDNYISNLLPTNTSNVICSTTSRNININDYLCQICLDTPRDCILEPCMHFSLCSGCVRLLPESKCPICRRPIEFYQNVFIS